MVGSGAMAAAAVGGNMMASGMSMLGSMSPGKSAAIKLQYLMLCALLINIVKRIFRVLSGFNILNF